MTAAEVYDPRPSKRATRAEIAKRLLRIQAIVAEIQPCSVRQVFYQRVVRGIADKTELAYKKIQRALVRLRREGLIPYRAIADGTRWQIRQRRFRRWSPPFVPFGWKRTRATASRIR
jgi:RecB family exonuclease